LSNFLVTGGTGQIGGFLCGELVRRGHRVVCYDFKPNLENIAPVADKVEVLTGDVTDLPEMLQIIKRSEIDRIIHLAAYLVLDSREHPARAYEVNIMGANNVLEAARLFDLKKVLFVSSAAVYGQPRTRRPGVADEEDTPDVPYDPYSTTKMTNELMGRFYSEKYGVDVACLRLAAAWGPGRYWGYTGQFNDFIRRVAVGEAATFPADFSYAGARFRWMYVKDAAGGFAHVSLLPKARRYLYNMGSKVPFTGRDVIGAVRAAVPDARVEFTEADQLTPVSKTVAGPNGLDIDCSRFYQELGFEPAFTLEGAVADMVAHERSRAGRSHR
jgi:UDP-glucose 4-epimerase